MWGFICEFFRMFFIAVGIVVSQVLTHALVKGFCDAREKKFKHDHVFFVWAVIFALVWVIV